MRDHPEQDIMDTPNTPAEATILKISAPLHDQELVTTTPEERPSLKFAPSHQTTNHVQQPLQLTDPFSKLDREYLETTAEALLTKIEQLRTEGWAQPLTKTESSGIPDSPCYPLAVPFLIKPSVFLSKIAKIPVTDRKPRSNPIVPMPNGNDPYAPIPIKEAFELGKIWTFNLNTELPQTHPPIPKPTKLAKKVHWNEEPTVLMIEPNGRMTPTTHFTIQEKKVRESDRQQKTGRSRYWRDQIKNIVATLRQIYART